MRVAFDLRIHQPDTAIQGQVRRHGKGKVGFKTLDVQVINGGHGAQNAEGAGIELEKLVVLHFGAEHGRIDPQTALHPFGLDAEFVGRGDLLVVLVAHLELRVHGLAGAAKAGVKPEVQQILRADGIEAAAAKTQAVAGIKGYVIAGRPTQGELGL